MEVLRDGVKFNLMPSFLGKNMTMYQRLYSFFSEPGLFQSVVFGLLEKLRSQVEVLCERMFGECKISGIHCWMTGAQSALGTLTLV